MSGEGRLMSSHLAMYISVHHCWDVTFGALVTCVCVCSMCVFILSCTTVGLPLSSWEPDLFV